MTIYSDTKYKKKIGFAPVLNCPCHPYHKATPQKNTLIFDRFLTDRSHTYNTKDSEVKSQVQKFDKG